MNLQNKEPEYFEVVLNTSANSLAGKKMDGVAVKKAVEEFNATRGVTGAEIVPPDVRNYSSQETALLRMLEIREDTRAATIGELKFNGDENGEWSVSGTVRPCGPYADRINELQQNNNLAFGMRALTRQDELQIIGWDVIDPANKV